MADAMQTNFAPLAATAIASSAAGSFSAQPVGQALSDIIIWHASMNCACAPPAGVVTSINYLTITAVSVSITVAALLLHYILLKLKG